MLTESAAIARYLHTPGNPVLDRTAALLTVRMQGFPGNAIAAVDEAVIHATGEACRVIAVDHGTGEVTVQPAGPGGRRRTLPGRDLVVTVPAHHGPVPDDYLDGMTIELARTAMTAMASDFGRYPQYGPGYFDRWVFARARRAVRHRGEAILVGGQRLLVNQDRDRSVCDSGPVTCRAWITRTDGIARPGRSVHVEARHITIEPGDDATVVAANTNRGLR